ncbi:MAG: zinc ribbon domain-containing protein [Proteobacteria bacterium]|nr:zinc ribbon domain-containing protein [Pseudomonadota bacterium]MBU1688609.1 zinc ribbon domain-containing protein [Pseudomonadota bacterium]
MFVDKRCYNIAKEKHYCPHCKEQLSCCHTPPYHVGDGLGWGTEIFFICLNDDCPLFNNSWEEFEINYGQSASCRYMLLPNEPKGGPMMVGSKDAFTGSIVDPEELEKTNERLNSEKEALRQLETCVEEKNLKPLITLIVDEEASLPGRHRACELLDKIDDLACIDPIRAHTFLHTEIGQYAELAIGRILKNQNRIECGYCAEIIKAQAKICKHCGKETRKG